MFGPQPHFKQPLPGGRPLLHIWPGCGHAPPMTQACGGIGCGDAPESCGGGGGGALPSGAPGHAPHAR
jgi:hypothetical protein